MKDIGHEETEKILKRIEQEISKEYALAEKEIQEKLNDYLRRFEIKDALKLKALDNGLITEQEYKQWRLGQVMIGERWKKMRDSIAEDLTHADQIAKSIAFEHMPEVYALNHDYGTYQIEHASLIDTSYTLYDRHAFEELVKNEDTFIPAPGRKVTRAINEGKALAWNKKQVQSVMMQGLLQGESIPNLASRLAKAVGETDRKAAIRNARTMTTGVQNAGRIASYDRANDMGIETRKQWLASLDTRTRHWHAALDGVTVPNNEPFTNEYGDIMYPGDPSADPANIFNCRCTLIASIKGFEHDVSNMDLRRDDKLGEMSYQDWREGHYTQTSDPITKQDTISEIMREKYNEEYRQYKNLEDKEPEAEELHGDKDAFKRVEEWAKDSKVTQRDVEDLEAPLTNEQIVEKLSGGDKTDGSCASLALSYCGNKVGMDVTDFRGGNSQATFARNSNIKATLQSANANIQEFKVAKEAADAAKIISNIDLNKEYLLTTGKHAAIIRRTEEFGLQYLEMQSPTHSGWQPFTRVRQYTFMGTEYTERTTVADTLRKRFGCRKSADVFKKSDGTKTVFEKTVMLAEVDSCQKTVEFRELLGYINTATDKQKKGASGGIK